MSDEATQARNCAVVQRLFDDVLNGGDLSGLPAIYDPDVVDHHALPGAPRGIAGIRYSISGVRWAYPDGRYTVESLVAKNDIVTARVAFSGTQARRLFRLASAAKEVTDTQFIVFRFRHGRIVERTAVRVGSRAARRLGLDDAQHVAH
jgi:predicted ester cyclase